MKRQLPRFLHTSFASSTVISLFMHARRLKVLLIWPFFNISPIWSLYVRLGRPLPTVPLIFALYTSFVNLFSSILSTCPNHRNIPLSILVTTSSFKPHFSLTTLFFTRSLSFTPHILLKALISTALILLSCFFCHTHDSLPYISVGASTRCITASRALLDIILLDITECKAPLTLFPAFTLLSISPLHFPSLVNKEPRYTNSFTCSNFSSPIITWHSVTNSFLSITNTFVLFTLTFIPFLSKASFITVIIRCSSSADEAISTWSSAYNNVLITVSLILNPHSPTFKSFKQLSMNKLNSQGDATQPCLTPRLMPNHSV
ncbi:uncharacterized protein LOC118265576 isoform X3 [Spodoptera frugiperda]|uniref:Uncharacterized protein LOC118265576 isoform X1 n=1 Tax=Spodoptera frugiperda TaxID=7108 RepID=A0A9R0E9Y9_SPOFR|nr:uncharacterized protein LOC118265576 isoform X1 [Spodoptera frugiperda]XP_050562061.1 uncharacterized protein LOC118265576 isoform X1 [Spodoptera frugiperda]XP_050562066.1 uncharacterized protein LOC118265576 isoform X3 [Spodoptera frugiperda]XP_050562067.1 uncharacterized protein LOC118265576 isoform X3 [Spodoptera frugiperda]XP_050562068.1 uncharacterized protein LOC118265576 isoform X3 [Spodoptera frugiperda]XP_050562072.1 uncharacterized protein LOC118265576 isoform X3 [Spodoptera frugi